METNLTEIIKKIRTAVLGREVRSSIADGLEYCGQISENAKADMDATAEAAKEAIDKTAEDAKNAIESNAASVKEQLSKDIDAKAAAALESIPEEYTELDGSVKQLKEDLGDIGAEFIRYNLFDKSKATVVSIMCNSSLVFITGNGVQSTIFKCDPDTVYTVSWNAATGNSRFVVYTSENMPVIDRVSKANRRIVLANTISGSTRHYETITTSENERYLLLYFGSTATGDENVLNSIQISKGANLLEYTSHENYEMPNFQLSQSQKDEILNSIPVSLNEMFANLFSYRQLGQLSKGYLCISFDDGYSTAESTTFPIIEEAQVPVTFCCWTESEIITNTTYLNELKTLISDYGCEVAQHGVGDFTTYSDKDLYKYLLSEKEKFSDLGILVNGMSYPNHKRNNNVRAICGGLYNVCQSGGTEYPIVYENNSGGERSNIFDLYRNSGYSRTLSQLEKGIDDALNNHRIYNVFWHDTDLENNADQVQKLKAMITYAKEKGITFITIGNIANAI